MLIDANGNTLIIDPGRATKIDAATKTKVGLASDAGVLNIWSKALKLAHQQGKNYSFSPADDIYAYGKNMEVFKM